MTNSTGQSYLENSLQNLTVDYLVGADTVLWPGWGGQNLSYAFNKLFFLTEGDFHIEINGRSYEGKSGQMFIMPANSTITHHAYNSSKAARSGYISAATVERRIYLTWWN